MAQLYAMVVKKTFDIYKSDGSGEIDKTYINILKQPMQTSKFSDFAEWKAAQEAGDASIILVQLTEAKYNEFLDPINLWIDGVGGLAKWQWNTSTSEIGHWDDPTDDQSTWNVDESIPDNRFRITIRHDATLAAPTGSSPFPDEIKVDQNDKTTGGEDNRVQLRFEIRNSSGVLVGNGRQEFYNAGTPTVIDLVNGVGQLFIDTTKAHGRNSFRSNHAYRVDNTKRKIEMIVFSKQIND